MLSYLNGLSQRDLTNNVVIIEVQLSQIVMLPISWGIELLIWFEERDKETKLVR